MPDWANPGEPPLVHDLVHWDRGAGAGGIVRAWEGQAALSFGDSESEELDLLAPLEMLPSHFVYLEYQTGVGTARVLHSYIERKRADDRIVRIQKDGMGPSLKGVSPPFTARGTAAFARSTDLGGELGMELAQAGHHGILLRWRADADNVRKLLPPPLEFTSDRMYCFLNQTQTGINRFKEAGESGLKHLARVNPHHVNWHEALFWIPCAYQGMRAHFDYCIYKDEDHGIVLGMFDGFWTKLVTFHKTFPFPAQPLNREMAPGSVARVTVSRFDEQMVAAEFTCTQELSRDEIRDELDLTGEMLNSTGLRYFPDYANPGGPPLVHDLVMWNMAAGQVSRAWRGDATLTLGKSDYEELHLFEPLEMLPSYYIDLRYQAGPGICKILHDYVADPIA
jgi:acetoacetate decarboxylase